MAEGGQLHLRPPAAPPARHPAPEQDGGHDDAGQGKNFPQMLRREEQPVLLAVAQHQLVEARQKQAVRDVRPVPLPPVQPETVPAVHLGAFQRQSVHHRLDLPLGTAEEIGRVPQGGGAVVGKVPPGQLQPGWPLLHGGEGRAQPEPLLLADGMDDPPCLRQVAQQAAPAVKDALPLPPGHVPGGAGGAQLLPRPGPARQLVQDDPGKVPLAFQGDILLPLHPVHVPQGVVPPPVEKQGQVGGVKQVNRPPDGPALDHLVRLRRTVPPDGQGVEGGGQKLGLYAVQIPAHRQGRGRTGQVLPRQDARPALPPIHGLFHLVLPHGQ